MADLLGGDPEGAVSGEPTRREVRSTSRLLLLDDRGRVLLFLHSDPTGRTFWALPGGGMEAGESHEATARREAAEELGAAEVDLTYLWTGLTEFRFADRDVSQTEAFYRVRGHSGVLGPEVEATRRREHILETRWWSLREIEASSERIFPVDLSDRIRMHVREVT